MTKKALKICILGTSYPYKGGISSFNERLAIELIEMGHQVEIITFTLQYPDFLYPGKNQYSDDKKPNLLKITRKLNSINPISWVITGRKIKSESYDLIISKFWLPIIGVSLGASIRIGRAKNTKVLSIIDNIVPHEKRIGDKVFTNFFIRSIDSAITMSKSVKNQTKLLFQNLKVRYHPHPVYDNYGELLNRNDALKFLKINEKRKYILFFGYIRNYKGLDVLIKAMSLIKDELPNVDVIVAGEFFSGSKRYLELIKKHDLQDRFILKTSFISNEEVKYYFSACDVVAQPYKSATQSGISQIATYFEKPIISTDVGGLKETVITGCNGLLSKATPKDFSVAMKRFFKEGYRYYDTKRIKELKKRYSWNAFTETLCKEYLSLLENDN